MAEETPYDSPNVLPFPDKLANKAPGLPLKSGGGDGTFDDMNARVAALEKGFERIEKKLDTLISDVSEVKGQLKAMPSAATFGDIKESLGELKGRVDGLPTTAKVASLFAIVVAVATLLTKWNEIVAFLHK